MTVILIPGLMCDATVWGPVTARLDAKVADLTRQNCLTQMAHDCLDDHPGRLTVAGHSMGARVAMEMARLAPDRIERLALLDTGAHSLAPGERARRDEIVRFANEQGMDALVERWLPPMVHRSNQTNTELMEALRQMVLRCDEALHARQIEALINRPNAMGYLGTISCPTLLMVGRFDAWSPIQQHKEMAAALPHARLCVIENAGHFAPIEQPELTCEVLVPFLAGMT